MIKEIIFYDDTFTINNERIYSLCEEMMRNDLNMKWKCETRANLVNKKLLEVMKRAGCYLISYGIESGSQRILNFLKKDTTIDEIKNAVNMGNNVGIKANGYFMIGIPTENEREIRQTIDFAKSLRLDTCQFSIATAYPGTELYKMVDGRRLIGDGSKLVYSGLNSNNVISLCGIKPEKLRTLMNRAYMEFYFRPSYLLRKAVELFNLNHLRYQIKGLKQLLRVIFNFQRSKSEITYDR